MSQALPLLQRHDVYPEPTPHDIAAVGVIVTVLAAAAAGLEAAELIGLSMSLVCGWSLYRAATRRRPGDNTPPSSAEHE
ncbi:MAG: hypothetical protein AB7O59_06610 [Pirellulales bacterium]